MLVKIRGQLTTACRVVCEDAKTWRWMLEVESSCGVGCGVNVGRQVFLTQRFEERAVSEDNELGVYGVLLTSAAAVLFQW